MDRYTIKIGRIGQGGKKEMLYKSHGHEKRGKGSRERERRARGEKERSGRRLGRQAGRVETLSLALV